MYLDVGRISAYFIVSLSHLKRTCDYRPLLNTSRFIGRVWHRPPSSASSCIGVVRALTGNELHAIKLRPTYSTAFFTSTSTMVIDPLVKLTCCMVLTLIVDTIPGFRWHAFCNFLFWKRISRFRVSHFYFAVAKATLTDHNGLYNWNQGSNKMFEPSCKRTRFVYLFRCYASRTQMCGRLYIQL